MLRAKGGTVFVIFLSVFLGFLLTTDPKVDLRIKLAHFMMKGIVETAPVFGADPLAVLNAINPFVKPGIGFDGVDSEDLTIPGLETSVFEGIVPTKDVKVRVYYPQGSFDTKLPVLVYFHGGGLCLGSAMDLKTDILVRKWAKEPALVISVDYRLGPQYPIPAPVDDSVAAILWVHAARYPLLERFADTQKIVLIGDSAGGYLVAAATQVIANKYPHVKIAHQVLIYPSMHVPESNPTASKKQFENGYILFSSLRKAFHRASLPANQDLIDSAINQPLRALSLSNLPPAQVVVAELDMLRDEGLLYANLLKHAGVDVTIHFVHGAVHGFFSMEFLPETQKVTEDIFKILREKVFV